MVNCRTRIATVKSIGENNKVGELRGNKVKRKKLVFSNVMIINIKYTNIVN